MSWTCPKCDKRFSRDNQSHWCEKVTQPQFLDYFPLQAKFYLEYLAFARTHFEVREQFSKKAVTWYAPNDKVFLVLYLKRKWIDCHYYLPDEFLEFPVYKTHWLRNNKLCTHYMRLHDAEDMDALLVRRLRESYAYAMGED